MNWLTLLERAGLITPLDRQLALFLGRADAEEPTTEAAEWVRLSVALCSRSLREGHVCLELWGLSERSLQGEGGELLPALPSFAELSSALAQCDAVEVVAAGLPERREGAALPPTKPLVLDRAGRLYFRRYFEHEQRLAAALAHLGRREEPDAPRDLGAHLERYFPGVGPDDGQRRAAELALQHRFLVVSGGPGTGKTATVVKILALFAELALERGGHAPRVLLLAPTGKAAARLKESIEQAKSKLELSARVRAAITDEAATIHRALGVHPASSTRFLRSAQNPLEAEVVIVDEASMVDVSLMRHLVESLPEDARLILLGDRYQLASVEAGSVLGELCSALARETEPAPAAWVELVRSYRFGEDSGIAALSAAVRQGQSQQALALLRGGYPDLRHQIETGPPQERKQLRAAVVAGFTAALRASSVERALSALGQFRVLCAHRSGPAGVEFVNDLCTNWLVRAGLLPERGEFVRGRPLLVTQNDYATGLYNGDVGLVWPDERGQLRAYFEGPQGLRDFSPSQLPQHETAFAITIHKSQGSEYDEVVVVLPQENSTLLSRELLYTAVTRARLGVVLSGSAAAIEVACGRSVERSSGLSEALLERWATQLASSNCSTV